jgi:hypothetical protein
LFEATNEKRHFGFLKLGNSEFKSGMDLFIDSTEEPHFFVVRVLSFVINFNKMKISEFPDIKLSINSKTASDIFFINSVNCIRINSIKYIFRSNSIVRSPLENDNWREIILSNQPVLISLSNVIEEATVFPSIQELTNSSLKNGVWCDKFQDFDHCGPHGFYFFF